MRNPLVSSLYTLLLLAAHAPSVHGAATPSAPLTPAPPPLTYILTANVTAGATITIGPVAGGTRVGLPIAGGTFAGPRLRGTLLPVGLDTGLMTADGGFDPDGTAVLRTDDGADIIFRDRGYQAGADAIYGAVTFETGADAYAWLDRAVAFSSAVLSADGEGSQIALNIFMLGDGSS
ncbi:hypothetical protein GGR52DRAFT_572594 [Hypoxylon sp. FL1284]|nr:hypothetical protein GGR52DRAFT_572594 [Hypoxylon sp. FL1284]